ncbi:hypothetical protein [Streptomyces sp. NBC_01334]|uniref:hypothetical protein n=1 Tax=Streptomyces sp. NBC_01334 TaxID=2903827 RepID=UPI002E1022E8|nr:hypothetical protein OG736_03470 [Streptomyces sp. NBC_01334]
MRSLLTALAAGAIVFGTAGIASADVNVDVGPQPSYTIVIGDRLQFAGDDVFNGEPGQVSGARSTSEP